MNTVSNTTSKPNKTTALVRVQALIAGTQKHFPASSFTLGNTAYTTATLVQALQSLESALQALSAAHASLKNAGLALNAIEAKVSPIIQDYRRYVMSAFSTAPQELADFGLQPPKARKPLSSDKRAAATAKLRSTRAARGTTSKKQKAAVKGNVTGVDITPVIGTSAPVLPPSPVANGASAAAAASASK